MDRQGRWMEIQDCIPVWRQLDAAQQGRILGALTSRRVSGGDLIHTGGLECTGVLLVRSGRLRAYILSEAGREITIYRLFPRDMCLLSASCMIRSIQFDITIEAEKDTKFWIIPAEIYKQIMETSAPAANYTNEIMAARFSEVMWLMEQIMWKSMDKRIAAFLLEETAIEGTNELKITHESIACHLGTHREVVTRMLHYFQKEGILRLARGVVEVTDIPKLNAICDS